jgi:DNA repair exonuclease SbcCD ATPase subunit
MITKVTVENFQCHRTLTLELESVTVLTGDNDVGKSAALRAILWAALNQWDGDARSFITWGERYCRVTLHAEKNKIVRGTDAASNYYLLNGKERFDAVGKEIPAAIQKVLNLGPDNFQGCEDPAFWVSLRAGEAASALNELFNLEEIDNSLDSVASKLRTAKAIVSVRESHLAEAQQEAESLAWTVQADKDLKQLEEMAAGLLAIDKEKERIEDLQVEIEMAECVEHNAEHLIKLAEKAIKLGQRLAEVEQITDSVKEIMKWESQVERLEGELANAQASLSKSLKNKCPLCGK